MKKVTLLATVLLALAMTASAQKMIDFTSLPDGMTPAPVQDGYQGLDWSGIDYVDAAIYPDADLYLKPAPKNAVNSGPGFYSGPEAMVAFIGGPLCFKNYGAPVQDGNVNKHICQGTISARRTALFQVLNVEVAAGWISNSVTFQAYNNGTLVGSETHSLTTSTEKLTFNWGPITELVITPNPNGHAGGSVVLYTLETE